MCEYMFLTGMRFYTDPSPFPHDFLKRYKYIHAYLYLQNFWYFTQPIVKSQFTFINFNTQIK